MCVHRFTQNKRSTSGVFFNHLNYTSFILNESPEPGSRIYPLAGNWERRHLFQPWELSDFTEGNQSTLVAEEADRQRDEGITSKHRLGQLRKNPECAVDKPGCLFCAEKVKVRKHTTEEQAGLGGAFWGQNEIVCKEEGKKRSRNQRIEKSDPRENSRKGHTLQKAAWINVLTATSRDQGLETCTHIRWFINACNSSLKGSDAP